MVGFLTQRSIELADCRVLDTDRSVGILPPVEPSTECQSTALCFHIAYRQ
jgi:hypothetical protein